MRFTFRPWLFVLACAFALYAAFATRTYYWDGVLFALNIESVAKGQASPATLFHPNHLLYSAFGYILYRAALACGLTFRAIAVLQVFNMLASTAAAALLYSIAKRVTGSAAVALVCLTLFAFGATWWRFSTDADAYMVTVLLLLLAIFFTLQDPPHLLLAALCHTLAMLFHQLAIFSYAAILAAILLEKRWPKEKRIWICAACFFGTGTSVGIVYWICYSQADHAAYPSLTAFVASYASDSGFTRSIGQILDSYLTSYIKLFFGGKLSLVRDYFSLASGVSLALCVAALGFAVTRLRRSGAETPVALDRRAVIVLWAWLLPYLIFLASWDPGSAFHKLFVWPPLVLLIGAYLASRQSQRVTGFAALAVAMAAWNFGAFIYPHSYASADPVLMLTRKIDRELPKNATIYYGAFSPDDWYLDYFAPGRKWVKIVKPQDISAASGPFCLETTALATWEQAKEMTQHWELVNAQHNVRLECFRAPR